MKFLESNWKKPDEGIWEMRGGRKHFTHSKMMAWVAFDRAIKLVETCGFRGRETSCPLAESSRTDSRRGLRARLQLEEESVYPILWIGCSSMRVCSRCRWLVFCRRR